MSLLVLGTVALDDVATPFGRRKQILGGSASHFAMSARLFTKVHLSAVIGADFPARYISFLRKRGVIMDSLIRSEGRTFRWQGEYRGDLNEAVTLNTELGVLAGFKPRVSQAERRIRHVFLANVDPDIQRYLLAKMGSTQLVGLDTMNYWIRHKPAALRRVLKMADVFVANDQEARVLSGEHNLIRAAQGLSGKGPSMVLIKKGEHGVLFYSKGMLFSLPAYPVEKVVDPTGAGDTFAGGFMGYLSKTKKINAASIKKALAYGTVAASFNVEGFGLERTARLALKGLNQRLNTFKKHFFF